MITREEFHNLEKGDVIIANDGTEIAVIGDCKRIFDIFKVMIRWPGETAEEIRYFNGSIVDEEFGIIMELTNAEIKKAA